MIARVGLESPHCRGGGRGPPRLVAVPHGTAPPGHRRVAGTRSKPGHLDVVSGLNLRSGCCCISAAFLSRGTWSLAYDDDDDDADDDGAGGDDDGDGDGDGADDGDDGDDDDDADDGDDDDVDDDDEDISKGVSFTGL